jgi:trans-aconitate 2-methyltransferase
VTDGAFEPLEWDAQAYSRASLPQRDWARDVIERLSLEGDETVLDAGCGSGEVTLELLKQIPRGRVLAVDASVAMVDRARRILPADRTDFLQADLTDLGLNGVADRIFSNAVFHWIPDHEALFGSLFRAIRPGGILSAQCGGTGNIAAVLEAWQEVTASDPFTALGPELAPGGRFAGPGETRGLLLEAGFDDCRCWLEDRVAAPTEPRSFLQAAGLALARAALSADHFELFTDKMMEALGNPETFDFVRLNIVARRS